MITELVLDSHLGPASVVSAGAPSPSPAASWRDFYVWSDTPDKYRDARIIFKDFETSNWTWDPVAKALLLAPLLFASARVSITTTRPCVRRCSTWWISGSAWASTDCASTPCPICTSAKAPTARTCPRRTPSCKSCARTVDENFADRMLLAEANQWPEDAVAYFGDGDECHMAFHFPLMPRMFMAARMEDRFPDRRHLAADAADPAELPVGAVPAQPRRADARDGHRRRARLHVSRLRRRIRQARINLGIRRRLAPLLGNDRRLIEMMNGLLSRCRARR